MSAIAIVVLDLATMRVVSAPVMSISTIELNGSGTEAKPGAVTRAVVIVVVVAAMLGLNG